MRKLKYHEGKLLKKVNFFQWKRDDLARENRILQRYGIADREDYAKYNRLVGFITKLTGKLRLLRDDDAFRFKMTEVLLQKLFALGIVSRKTSLAQCDGLRASAFCRRRLAVVLVRQKFCSHIDQSIQYISHGHVRIGPDVITDPAFHVSREAEDHIGWSEGSSIKRKVREFNDELDEFELLGN